MQFPPKHPIKAFLVFFIPIYTILVTVGLLGLDKTYDKIYRSLGDTFFSEIGDKGIVRFIEEIDPTTSEMASMAMLINRDQNNAAVANGTSVRAAKIVVEPWRMGYLPIALLISLILSTPIPWKRRLFSLLWGMLAVSVFIIFRTWIFLKYFFYEKEWLEVVTPEGFGANMLEWSYSVFVYNIVLALIVPVLIWILVTFRKEDKGLLQEVLGPLGRGGAKG